LEESAESMARVAATWDAAKMSTLEMSAKGMTKQSNSYSCMGYPNSIVTIKKNTVSISQIILIIGFVQLTANSIHNKPNYLDHWLFPATTVEAQIICGCLIDTTCMDFG
jgi:hypothetical protein